jgi:hypothetical protein
MKSRAIAAIAALLALAALWTGFSKLNRPPRASSPLEHQVYVWQRAWSPGVQHAVSQQNPNFSRLVVLAAEVTWTPHQPRLERAQLDFNTLRRLQTPVALALRIGPLPTRAATTVDPNPWLIELARATTHEAHLQGLSLAELHLDFDATESQLDQYRQWVQSIQLAIHPVPLTLTALPAWLDRPAFRALVQATAGFVLQVHSLERPSDPQSPFALCDPAAARRAVERAARFNVPFRVALPTYGYLLAFDPGGAFVGLSAEGPLPHWPQSTTLRPVESDPAAMAQLINTWNLDRPTLLTGLIWYRLPVPTDRLNWHPTTLAAVMAGATPQANLQLEIHETQPALFDIHLSNHGHAHSTDSVAITARWTGARRVASDALGDFEATEPDAGSLQWHSRQPLRIAPQERRSVGWLRLTRPTEVQFALGTAAPTP